MPLEVVNPTGKGVPARLYLGQTLPRFVPGAFKALFTTAGDNFEAELAKHFTAEGASYYATPQGTMELVRFAQFLKVCGEKPKY